ncbi:MAG: CDP-alcohol phosphatidyltransferase family protein [Chitinivibrionales bacterium]|nr:CDP-alcohol phosphatidyltransferase family protein [Chitinivibrionales bacterium]
MYILEMNFASLITASRVVLAPFFAYMFLYGQRSGSSAGWLWAAVAVLIVMQVSDALDGHVARMRNEVTDFGKLFDPLADSLCNQIIFVALLAARIIPVWMLLIVIYREAALIIIRFLGLQNNIVVAARSSGKLKTVLQGVGIFCVMAVMLAARYNPHLVPMRAGSMHTGFWIMLAPVAVSVISMFDYVVKFRKMLLKSLPGSQ